MDLTPKAVVRELDRYIIGQADAKRSVAILCNRYRRSLLMKNSEKKLHLRIL